jgi:hypothetical protein
MPAFGRAFSLENRMDLTSLGINAGIIVAIMGITEVAKSQFDPAGKLARFYILLPTFLGLVAALVMTRPLEVQELAKNAILYVGAAVYLYKFGRTTVLGK